MLQALHGLQERLVVDTSEGHPVYLLAVGKHHTYLRLSPIAHHLLQQRSVGVSFASLAETMSQAGKPVSPAEVEMAYDKVVERITEIERSAKPIGADFLWRWTLLPESLVVRLASWLSMAFHKPIAYGLLAGIVAATAIAPRQTFTFNDTPTGFLWSYLLFLGSLVMHELGHASACARYGARPSGIGLTIYLIFPAFYSDVSAAWELRRWQRVIVDLGGAFFQLVVGAGYAIAYTLSGWEPLKVAVMMIAGSCFFSLNPIFKFDGYWVVADALGVTNLSQQPCRILRHLFDRLRGRQAKPLPWSSFVTGVVTLYLLLSFGVWGYFLWLVLPMLWQRVLGYPSLAVALIQHLLHPSNAVDIGRLHAFLISTFMVTVVLLMLRRLVMLMLASARSPRLRNISFLHRLFKLELPGAIKGKFTARWLAGKVTSVAKRPFR
jgi:putative peptide zinc metalloprotease protein